MRKENEAKTAKEEEEKMKIEKQEMQQETSIQNISDQKKFKTKEVQECEEGLIALIKPFDVSTMDIVGLKEKASELYNILANLKNDKINSSKRMAEQDCVFKNVREKLFILLDNKGSRKGFIDMEKYYPGTKRNSAKTTKEKTGKERPQVLANVSEEKFNTWMNSAQADCREKE